MISKIKNVDDYIEAMNQIEDFIQKATRNGGIHTLPEADEEALHQLAMLVSDYEKGFNLLDFEPPKSLA